MGFLEDVVVGGLRRCGYVRGKMLEVSGVGEAKNEFELESEPC